MFNGALIFGLLVLALVVLSIRERMRIKIFREKSWDTIGESKASPLSQALTNLIGTAGGIYLSIVMLFTFLEVQVPTRVQLWAVNIEPLATISFGLAILQPFVLRLFQLTRRFR